MPIEVTFFRFATINVRPDETCRTELEGGRLRLTYRFSGQNPQTANLDPDSTPDAAATLSTLGWWPRLSRRDSAREPNGRALPQPAAMGKAGDFASLSLDFSTTAFCRCRDIAALCKKTRLRLTVDYGGTQHPAVKAFISPERDCSAADVDPTRSLRASTSDNPIAPGDDNVEPAEDAWVADILGYLPRAEQAQTRARLEGDVRRAHADGRGKRKRFVFFHFGQTCPCQEGADPPIEPVDPDQPVGERLDPRWRLIIPRACDILIEVEYNYLETPG